MCAPFLGEGLEDLGRFVADDILAFGYGPDQAAEDGQAAEGEVGAAVIDTDLGVTLEEGFGRIVIADTNLAIGARVTTRKVPSFMVFVLR